MKVIRAVVLLAVFYVILSIPFSVQAKHCSHITLLSKDWIKCSTSSDKSGNGETNTSAEPKKKEKKSLWDTIKHIGGKNIGEPG